MSVPPAQIDFVIFTDFLLHYHKFKLTLDVNLEIQRQKGKISLLFWLGKQGKWTHPSIRTQIIIIQKSLKKALFCLALVFAQNFQLLWLKFWMNWTETKWSIACTLVRLNTFLARKSGKVSVHRISMFKLNWTENKARDCNWAPHRFGWEQFVCPYILKSAL